MKKYPTLTVSKNITLSSGDGYYDITYSFPIAQLKKVVEFRGVKNGFHGFNIKLKEGRGCEFGRKRRELLEDLLAYLKDNNIKFEHEIVGNNPSPGY